MDSPSYELITAAGVVSVAISFVLYLGLVAVAVFVVRPARSSAGILIASGGALALLTLCVGTVLPIGFSRAFATEAYVSYLAVGNLLGAAMHLVWFSCVIAGIVQLARASKPGPREGD